MRFRRIRFAKSIIVIETQAPKPPAGRLPQESLRNGLGVAAPAGDCLKDGSKVFKQNRPIRIVLQRRQRRNPPIRCPPAPSQGAAPQATFGTTQASLPQPLEPFLGRALTIL